MSDTLITSLQNMKNESSGNYHILFDEIIKKSIIDLHEIIKTDLIKDIVPHIRGTDMYDYTESDELCTIEEIKKSIILGKLEQKAQDYSYIKDLNEQSSRSKDIYKTYHSIEAYNKFITMKEDEKIVYMHTIKLHLYSCDKRYILEKWHTNHYDNEPRCIPYVIFLTNHAKLMCYNTINYDNRISGYCKMVEYDFLIPKDYINIIKKLTHELTCQEFYQDHNRSISTTYNNTHMQLYNNISKLLHELKSSLYCNKFVPLFVHEEHNILKKEMNETKTKLEKDYQQKITDMNKIRKKLEEDHLQKLEEINNNKNELQLEKEYFNINIQPYVDLKKDRELLDKKTQLFNDTIEMEKDKNKKEYEKLKQQIEIEKENNRKEYEKLKQQIEIEKENNRKEYEKLNHQVEIEKEKIKLRILKYKKDVEELNIENNKLSQEKTNFEIEKKKAYELDD
jgi:hypothetical protein